MNIGRINAWPAFADMVFVLFVCTLIAAVTFKGKIEALEGFEQKLEEERQKAFALQSERDKALTELGGDDAEEESLIEWVRQVVAERNALRASHKQCGGAGPLLDGLRKCLDIPASEAANDCTVQIGEDRVRFVSSRASFANTRRGRVNYRNNAELLARCLAREEIQFWQEHPDDFRSIKSIYIDGHTDCQGNPFNNASLGFKRAKVLLEMYRKEIKEQAKREGLTMGEQRELERKVNVRSFGENLPTKGSACLVKDNQKVPADRRVTVSVEQQVSGGPG